MRRIVCTVSPKTGAVAVKASESDDYNDYIDYEREYEVGSGYASYPTEVQMKRDIEADAPAAVFEYYDDVDPEIADKVNELSDKEILKYVTVTVFDPIETEARYGDLTVLAVPANIAFHIKAFKRDFGLA